MIDFSSNNFFSGIHLDLSSSTRLEKQIYPNLDLSKDYKIMLSLPLLLLTVDQGFFKQNVTVHCSRTEKNREEGKRRKEDKKEKEEDEKEKENEEEKIEEEEEEGDKQPFLIKNNVCYL